VGLSSTVWFVIAVIALLIGAALLLADSRRGSGAKDRKRWAAMRGWEFLDTDPVLPSRWRYGTIHQGGPGVARNLISGDVPTPDGPRMAYVFDHEQAGRLTSILVAVQLQEPLPAAVELRLPSAPLPDDAGLDLLEPVGERYAFVSDATTIRPLITPRLAQAADAIGEEVELLWAEDSWVLCTAPLDAAPEHLQELLDQLIEVAASLEEAVRVGGAAPRPTAAGRPEPSGPAPSSSSAASWARSFSARPTFRPSPGRRFREQSESVDGPEVTDEVDRPYPDNNSTRP
jgi:hypothetical protein